MTKLFRVKQDTFLWDKGAILKGSLDDGYRAISDLWDHVDTGSEYISGHIVENKDNADFFERVHEISLLGKAKYMTSAQARAYHDETFKES